MPLRVRLTLWYGIALAVILIGFAVVLYAVMAQGLKDQVDQQLETAARAAARAIEQHPLGPFLQFEDFSSQFPELAVLDRFFQIFSPNGKITIQSPNLKAHDIPLNRIALQGAFEGKTVFQSAKFPGEPAYRLVSVPITYNGTLFNIVQVGTSLAPLQESLDRLLLTLLITVPAALILSLAGGWFLAGRALKPVESITLAAQRIASGDLTQRLTVARTGDEIGRLAATFNDMIARLDASFRQIRQFSSDASHELRTPLTVLKGETELALRRPRAAEDYRLVLESSLEEIDRMSRIVDELLFLSRADLGEVSLESSDVALQPLVEDIHRQATVLGQDQGVHVSLGPIEPAVARGDELRLRELLLNLMDNAIKYSRPGGKVEIGLTCDRGHARIAVTDEGIGIEPGALGRIFDRFYRTDAARAHAKSGTGLGLAICKWIAEAHKGRIEVQSRPDAGSRFTLMLPLHATDSRPPRH